MLRSFNDSNRKVTRKASLVNKIIYQELNTQISTSKPEFEMDTYNIPMSKAYTYGSVGSFGIDYDVPNQPNYEFFDSFLVFDDWINEDQESSVPEYADYAPVYASPAIDDGNQSNGSSIGSHLQENCIRGSTGSVQTLKVTKDKVAFKTKSQVEILDDGFKWRKYGKKMVKNSPNPRNYYRCSAEGCLVKKRVQRDVEDAQYVITTYEGVHNHQRPSNF